MKPNEFEIVLDMDGVIADIVPAVVNQLNEKHDENLTPSDIISYNFKDVCKIATGEDIHNIFNQESFFYYLDPIPGAVVAISQLILYGFNVSIVTACTYGYNEKQAWLRKWIPSFDVYQNLNFTRRKERFSGHVFVDDFTENLLAYAKRNKNALTICFDAPYNQTFRGERVKDWDELYARIFDCFSFWSIKNSKR